MEPTARTSREARETREERMRTPRAYRIADLFSGALILFLVVGTPWFFGTTEDWAVWLMTGVCFALGAALLVKHAVRRLARYAPPRVAGEGRSAAWLRRALFAANVLVLGYCLVAALNGRATFYPNEQRFEYYNSYIRWLPFSYDTRLSWFIFWQYSGLFFFFWSLRDWLLGRPRGDKKKVRRSRPDEADFEEALLTPHTLPARLKTLLWVVCINGMLLALQGILQRLDGSGKLLWFRPSWWGTPESCFGPFSYRSNGAQYINLIWPVCFAFWWVLNQSRVSSLGKLMRVGDGPQLVLIPATVVMASAPIISTSRGGAFVAGLSFVLMMGVMLFNRRTSRTMRISLGVLAVAVVATAGFLGWERLSQRLRSLEKDKWSNRGEIYVNAEEIAAQYPTFGTGPGTFRSVYQLYRDTPRQKWYAFVHDDWLETQITFGIVGTTLVLLNLALVLIAWLFPGRIDVPSVLPASILISLGGCLLHARFDFPLQIYSILFMFVLLSCILFCTSRPRAG